MRAKEFTINVPITIKINGDNTPEIETSNAINNSDTNDDSELQMNPVMISPQQQELELKKAELGKSSPVINKLTNQETIGNEPLEQDDIIKKLKFLLANS